MTRCLSQKSIKVLKFVKKKQKVFPTGAGYNKELVQKLSSLTRSGYLKKKRTTKPGGATGILHGNEYTLSKKGKKVLRKRRKPKLIKDR